MPIPSVSQRRQVSAKPFDAQNREQHTLHAAALAAIFILLFVGWPNLGLAAGALAVLAFGMALLWRPGEPPILVYVFGFQWLQASAAIFYANVLGQPIDAMAATGSPLELATALSLIALVALTLGIRYGAGRQRPQDGALARRQALTISQRSWLHLYGIAFVTSLISLKAANLIPGLGQLLLALADLKWAAFVIFTYATFVSTKSNRSLWFAVFLFELVLSFGGYFSDFKSVFIYSLMGIAAARIRFNLPEKAFIASMVVMLIGLGVIWTAVKVEYRTFVSGGETAQVVSGDYATRLAKLGELAVSIDADRMHTALISLIERVAYVEYFGAVIAYVPAHKPHEAGALWLDAIRRPFMPRLLFPGKTAIDESALTASYTGLSLAGTEDGTSISIGYIGESYIDFGALGMMIPIFAMGLLIGKIYRWLLTDRYTRGILGAGMASAILTGVSAIENSSAKMFGALLASTLTAYLLSRFVFPTLLSWLRTKASTR